MSELIANLQAIYNAKLSIKAAIGTQSDELADYAGYITALKPNGYTYINENGDFNVSSYEYAYVNVPTGSGETIAQKNAAWKTKWAPALSTMAAGLYQQDPSYGEPQISDASGWCIQTAIDGDAAMSEMIAMACLWIEIYGSGSLLHNQYAQIFTQMGLTLDSDGYLVSTDDDKLIPFDADEALISNLMGVEGFGVVGGKRISSLNGGVENAPWDYYGLVFNGSGFDYVSLGQFNYVVDQGAMIRKMNADGVTFINNIPAVNQSTLFNYLEAFQIDEYTPYKTLNITSNGTFDVTTYASAYVNVPTGGGTGSGDVIFVNSIQASDFQNLDGMNNLLSYNGVYCYALNQETFTKRYPSSGYLYPLPSMLHISKDDNVNAYLFEATSFTYRGNSYSGAYNNGAGDISVIDQNPEAITSNDQFTGRLTFLYNTYQLRSPKIQSVGGGVYNYQNGPFCNDGINVDPSIETAFNSQIIVEHIPFKYDKETSVMRTSDLGLTNFGSYVVFGETGLDFADIFDNLNHMTYDCLLQRTSYKGGFGDGKYECVFVDTYNYVGELQQSEIYGVKYGSDQFDYDSDTQCYTYVITLPANGNIQAKTTYFEFDVTSSSLTNYERFLFCEDISGTLPQPLNFKTVKSNDVITDVKVDAKSPYICKVGSRYPSYYMQNKNSDEITFKLSINKNTWRVSSELYEEPEE